MTLRRNFIRSGRGQTCAIEVRLDSEQTVQIRIYARNGARVRVLTDGPAGPGVLRVQWRGENDQGLQVGSGIYLAVITTGSFQTIRKMVVVR